jgi:hypothetical protein
MVALIACLVGPVIAAPLIALLSRHLFALFVREGTSLFVGLEMHKEWSLTLGTPIAIANAIIFSLGWWASVALGALDVPSISVAAPLIVALALALFITYILVKDKLHLETGDAFLVGLLAFAGGNLPVIIAMPMLLMAVLRQ